MLRDAKKKGRKGSAKGGAKGGGAWALPAAGLLSIVARNAMAASWAEAMYTRLRTVTTRDLRVS